MVKDWNHLPFNPMKPVSDVFKDIPNGREIKELQEVVRSFLESCKVSHMYSWKGNACISYTHIHAFI